MSGLNLTALHQAILQSGFTVDDEKAFIAADLNTSMLQALLMGIYTVVFGGTLYAYATRTRQPSKPYFIPIAISLLYISNLALFGVQWFSTKFQLVDNSETRDTMFLAIYTNTDQVAANTVGFIFSIIAVALIDVLLIWRCFNLWDRSIRVIFIPAFFAFTETGKPTIKLNILTKVDRKPFQALMLTEAIGGVIVPLSAHSVHARLDSLSSAGLMMSACTTIITTALIAYRIHSFLRHKDISSSKKFHHVVDIIVQSGVITSFSLLFLGVSTILTTWINVQILSILEYWAFAFAFLVAGISTTIMVARVATLSESDDTNPSVSYHLPEIQFRPRSTAHTGTGAQVSVRISTVNDASGELAVEAAQEKGSDAKEKQIQDV
ncbi:hypothetical protein BDN70DRAFT_936274 [Pholiota conissans]|uniref:Uncharacterized protein n=1 Tax=Pholiota conissans TaxID=109636 RepID=A0A9P5YW21_9AGAR|nr:hypothetical protein BDN70DRAFT_936274 [Pholiota conissans]